jgi:hypothetical protein
VIWGKSCDDFARGGQPFGKLQVKMVTVNPSFQSQFISDVITEVVLKMVEKPLALK